MTTAALVLGMVAWLGVTSSQEQTLQRANALYNHADARLQAGDNEGALRSFEQALPLYREAEDRVGEAMALLRSGLTLLELKGCEQALPTLQQALPLIQATPRHEWEGVALFSLGRCHLHLEKRREALDLLQRAIPLLETKGNRLLLAMALAFVGNLLEQQGQTQQALEAFKRAGPLFHAEGNMPMEALCAYVVANLYYGNSEYALAREQFQKTLSLFLAMDERLQAAYVLVILGDLANYQGKFQEMLTYYQRAISLYEELQAPGAKAQAEFSLGSFYQDMGNHALALQYFQRAHDSWGLMGQQPRVKVEVPRQLEDMGGLMTRVHQNVLHDSHQKMQSIVLKLMGTEQARLGQWSAAETSYKRASTLLQTLKDPAGEAELHLMMATLHEARWEELKARGDSEGAREESQKALGAYKRAQDMFKALGDKTQEALSVVGGMMLLPKLNLPEEATKALAYLEKLLEQMQHPRYQAIILDSMALTANQLEDSTRALGYYQRGLALYEQLGEPHRAAKVLVSIGLTHEVMGEAAKALEAHEMAIALIERARATAGPEEVKTRLASDSWLAYESAIRLRLGRREVARAFALSERGRARSFLDVLGSARTELGAKTGNGLIEKDRALAQKLAALDRQIAQEKSRLRGSQEEDTVTPLEERRARLRREADDLLLRLKTTDPRYASLQSVETLSLPEVQKLLDERTTLVSYVTLEYVVAFAITRNSIAAIQLPLTTEQLRELVPGTFNLMASADRRVMPTKALEKLHTQLVAPLLPHLKTPRVGIIPHGVLHYLPFASLTDGKQYMGDRYTLFFLPSASTLRYLPKERVGQGPVLVMSQAEAEGFSILEFANTEARTIAKLYGVTELTGPTATEAAFKQSAHKASLLHVAAHGELDDASPLFSRIVLAPGEGEDGSLTVGEAYDLDLSASRLVVLSACQTNVGAHSQGDDVVGLTRAFFYAQAPAVLASLWKVDDEATGVLMAEFHAQLKNGRDKADALQAAQAHTRARFPHPYHWAAFVLTGDPN